MTSTRKHFLKTFLFLAAFLSLCGMAHADRVGFKGMEDVCIDIPEGFQVVDATQDGKSFQLSSTVVPVGALVKLASYGEFTSSKTFLETTMSKFGLKPKCTQVEWRNLTCTYGEATGTLTGNQDFAMAASVILPMDRGALFVMTWCASKDKASSQDYMESLLDGICVDAGSAFCTGLMTQMKHPRSEEKVDVKLEIDGKKINTCMRKNDSEASQYLIEREYRVLCLYQTSNLWMYAWQRYYRMIFRDSFKRLQKPAFDIYNALSPDCTDDTDLAQKLLTWTQSFSYERETTASDFANLPSILLGGGSDCDSRSLLLAVLLQNMNQDAIIFVSAQYSHAIAGFVSTHPGHSFKVGEKEYLMGETTCKGLTWGKISQDQDVRNNWIEVVLP